MSYYPSRKERNYGAEIDALKVRIEELEEKTAKL